MSLETSRYHPILFSHLVCVPAFARNAEQHGQVPALVPWSILPPLLALGRGLELQ